MASKVIVDQRGREIVLPDEVSRIVTLPMPAPALLFAVDASGEKIVGMHPKSLEAVKNSILGTIAPEMKSIVSSFVKKGFEPNVEEVLKLNPDVVLQWCNRGEEIIKPLEDTGIAVIGLKYGSQSDLEEWLRIFGKILNKEEKAEEIITYHHENLEKIQDVISTVSEREKPRILYLPYGSKLYTTGQGTYNQCYFDWTGAKNVAEE